MIHKVDDSIVAADEFVDYTDPAITLLAQQFSQQIIQLMIIVS